MIDVEGLPIWGGLQLAPLSGARVVVAGFPYDESATYRRGARHAPALVRRLSAVMPPVDERGRCLGDVTLHDLGDLELGNSVATGWETAAARLSEVSPSSSGESEYECCSENPSAKPSLARNPSAQVSQL